MKLSANHSRGWLGLGYMDAFKLKHHPAVLAAPIDIHRDGGLDSQFFSQPLEVMDWASPAGEGSTCPKQNRASCRVLEVTTGYLIVMARYILQPVVRQ